MPAFALFAIVAIVGALGAALEEQPRPNLTEWQETKANESAAEAAVVAKQKKMAAVDKAVELLEGLQAQVLKEGEEEAATYNKFACWCKDTTADKLEAIQKGEDEKDALSTEIGRLSDHRDQLDTDIQSEEGAIAADEQAMKEATHEREQTHNLYKTNDADLTAALEALQGAIKMLKASKSPSLAQIKYVSETVRTATVLADALGVGGGAGQKLASMFLQEPADEVPANEVQMEDYKFHSDDIIATLEKLLDEFRAEKDEVDKAEVSSVKAYDSLMQEETHAVKVAKAAMAQKKQEREDTIDDIASNSQQLSTVSATLLDDKEYANKLSQMCTDKAKTWDQRWRVRRDELSTLTQAIGIIKGAVAENTTAATIRFAQQGVSVHLAKAIATDAAAMNTIEAEAEAADSSDVESPSLMQLVHQASTRGSAHRFLAANSRPLDVEGDGRQMVATLLASKGRQLKSTLLASLASQIAKDPFAKVKQLIQELIERLLQEAANEADQKGWCDKATSDAKQKREYAAEEIVGLNGEMAKLEAERDQLAEELADLAKAIQELIAARETAEAERKAENLENMATIDEAQQGLDALDMCINLLDKFYKTINKETVDLFLAQASPEDDAPDAGFANGEAYTGAQSESGGILGMLDVMKSDFVRTMQETRQAEAQAVQDHLEFMTQSGMSLKQKEEAEAQKKAQKTDREAKLSEEGDKLKDQTDMLESAIKELLDLKPACVDTGMSYADRVANREDEIAALNKAMCILGRYEEYGPEGAADGC